MSKHLFRVKIWNQVPGENVLISRGNASIGNGGNVSLIRSGDMEIFPSVDNLETFQVLYVKMENQTGSSVVLDNKNPGQCNSTTLGAREWKLDFSPVSNHTVQPMILKSVTEGDSTCSTITVNIGTGEPPVPMFFSKAATWTCGAFFGLLVAPFIKDISNPLWIGLTAATAIASLVLRYLSRKKDSR